MYVCTNMYLFGAEKKTMSILTCEGLMYALIVIVNTHARHS